MTLAVWKFTMDLSEIHSDQFEVEMPEGAQLLHIDRSVNTMKEFEVSLWALVDTEARLVKRGLIVHGTGHNADDVNGAEFVGTVVLTKTSIPLVFHFWDRGEL